MSDLNGGGDVDLVVPDSPSDCVSSLSFAPLPVGSTHSDLLASSSWDSSVCVFELSANGACVPRARLTQSAPVLTTSWNQQRNKVAFAGCEKIVKVWDVHTNQVTNIGQHGEPVKQLIDLGGMSSQAAGLPGLVSGGWDKKVKYWDPNTPSPTGAGVLEVDVPDKVYAMDQRGFGLLVATAERHIRLFDLRKAQSPVRTIQCPLKFQSRSISFFPNGEGFALGSIEGRVSIQHLAPEQESANFSFKCHRGKNPDGTENITPVHAIEFHMKHGTFLTAGGDGVIAFWDKDSKQRLKIFSAQKNPVVAARFNPAGTIMAYAVGYDWSKGLPSGNVSLQPNHIAIHKVADAEIAKKVQQAQR